MRQFTDITVLLDRSGSMESCKEAMETGFNKFIKEHRVNPSTRVTLVQFDSVNDQEVVYQSVPVGAVEKMVLAPRGGTPLLDALCQVIDNTGKRYAALPENERPDQVLFVIITDGEENASKIYKRKDVLNRITRQKDVYNWNFLYLGANQDAIQEAASYGIGSSSSIQYNYHNTDNLWKGLVTNTVAYASTSGRLRGTKSAEQKLAWTNTQREEANDDEV